MEYSQVHLFHYLHPFNSPHYFHSHYVFLNLLVICTILSILYDYAQFDTISLSVVEKEQFVCKTKQKQYMLLPIMRRKLYLFLYSGGLVSRCLSTILSCYLSFCDPHCPHSLGCEWNSLRSSQILAQFWSTHVPHH